MAQNSRENGKPPRFWFGPGLLLAISASLLIWRFAPHNTARPIIEHAVIPAAETTGLSAPDPQWLFAHIDQVGLKDSQKSRLQSLAGRWDHETTILRSELRQASEEFTAIVPSSGRRGDSLEQIQLGTTRVSELTRRLLDARRSWWNVASSLFTPEQRRQAEWAWSQRFIIGGSEGQ